MDKYYAAKDFEINHYQECLNNNYFKPDDSKKGYTISLPPPNVTGTLHMGHAFQSTLIDILIRYHRIRGYSTLWQPGTDHAGIATQIVVKNQLIKKGMLPDNIGRDAFIKEVWKWKNTSGNHITNQLHRLLASADWSRDIFTMDEGYSYAVNFAFSKLYQDKLIYRGNRLVNWDSTLQTALSDLEVSHKEEKGELYFISYKTTGQDTIEIATTRPETMFGDAALAVHPEDSRYQSHVGKMAIIPFTSRNIPIIADNMVDSSFGTGVVKITPAHDFNDYQMMQRHREIGTRVIFTADGKLNENVPKEFQNLEIAHAREKVVHALSDCGALVKTKDHMLSIPIGERSGAIIEPRLTKQWFVDLTSEHGYKKLVLPALSAIKNRELTIYPHEWGRNYEMWLNNIQDWCISRQIWWGHRIPIWYDKHQNQYLGENENEVREKYSLNQNQTLTQDQDVLDTWFSSALWPMANIGWPKKPIDEKKYPNSTLVTGFDILFFWVIRMVLFGKYFTKKVPFYKVYIHGLVRDSEGNKMSKSKGNILDPIDIIDGINLEHLIKKRTTSIMQPSQKNKIVQNTKRDFAKGIKPYGLDSVRFSFASMSNSGRDIRFDLKRIEGYRNFCNKLWNASKFLRLNLNQEILSSMDMVVPPLSSVPNKWINSQLTKTFDKYRASIEIYKFNIMADSLYHFIWDDYCSWYLELIKPILANDSNTQRNSLVVLRQALVALHPIIPGITQAIWQELSPNLPPLTVMKFDFETKGIFDEHLQSNFDYFKNCIIAIRNCKDQWKISPKKSFDITIIETETKRLKFLSQVKSLFSTLLKYNNIHFASEANEELMNFPLMAHMSHIAQAGTNEIILHYSISKRESGVHLLKINQDIKSIDTEIAMISAKLNNTGFMRNAKPEIIAQYNETLKNKMGSKELLISQKSRISALIEKL